MNPTLLLAGSLSNDLFRIATLAHRGSHQSAKRFLQEAKRWASELQHAEVKEYIRRIAKDVAVRDSDDISLESAERYLMYGVQLQNYCLHAAE